MPLPSYSQMPVVPLQIKFLFYDNIFAVEVCQNGVTKLLTDSLGNEWTPLYLSMVETTPEIGENAKRYYQNFSKHVIYDILKIIGKPLNQIKIDPKWGFELIETDGNLYYQIETLSGARRLSQEIVIAAFLKSMKLRTESALNASIAEIIIYANLELN
uniref:Bifunctional nuclease family protein n=1 Tax=Panagrolaimus sp. ES5 TaxID=591445 RepID=A0AC34GFG4_9BILA